MNIETFKNIKSFNDLSEMTKEHICNAIKDGYTQGEICELVYDEEKDKDYELRGWWKIGNGCIEIVRLDDIEDYIK